MSGPRRRSNGMARELQYLPCEGGHAMVAAALHHTDPGHCATILPRGVRLIQLLCLQKTVIPRRAMSFDQLVYVRAARWLKWAFHDPGTGLPMILSMPRR